MTKSSASSTAFDLLLAVDAGGTKTAALLARTDETGQSCILGRGQSTAGNPLSVGFPGATRAITEAIDLARCEANHGDGTVSRLILAVAGAANDEIGKRFVDWARTTGLAERVAIVSDVLPVLAAGTPQCRGVALVAGTGSVALGRGGSGRAKLCGGWGYLLGDGGSAYDVGRAALQHALYFLQSGAARDCLTDAVIKTLAAASVMEITRAVYSSADPRALIASVAQCVVELAGKAEPASQSIVDSAAVELANLAAGAAALVDLGPGRIPLAVSGGLLVSSRRLQDRLLAELQRRNLDCEMTVIEEPLVGCIRLADREFDGNLVDWR